MKNVVSKIVYVVLLSCAMACTNNNDVKPKYPIEVFVTKEAWTDVKMDNGYFKREYPDYNQVMVVLSIRGDGFDMSRFATFSISSIDPNGKNLFNLSDKNTRGSVVMKANIGQQAADVGRMEIKYKISCYDKGGKERIFEGYATNGESL